MNMNFKPAFQYELKNMLLGSATFFAAIVVLIAITVVASTRGSANVSFSGYCISSTICLFVFGVVEPRPCLRLCAQLGVSRRTAFLCNIAAAIVAAFFLAVAGELLLSAGRLASRGELVIADLYQLIYLGGRYQVPLALSFPQHLINILFNTLLSAAAYCGGMFFTYLFWRLNKVWTVVTAISIPVVLNVVPLLLSRSASITRAAASFFSWLGASVWNSLFVFVLLSALLCIICYLLVRNANIKAPLNK